jgi:2-oxoglutarate/2-oxoacid ferredoxin oxidoreductase subunit alpha
MATGDLALGPEQGQAESPIAQKRITNDFSIQVATVNGSGSQSANSVLLKSIFGMGIPVSGKNLFPSNIAGLPTWYTIRASKNGYVARKKEIDILVALNPEMTFFRCRPEQLPSTKHHWIYSSIARM